MKSRRYAPGRRRTASALPLALLGLIVACGGSDPATPDPRISPLVGDWEAAALEMSHTLAPISLDLIESGASFTINIQPSGQYTAILFFAGQNQTELGQVEVDGDRITISPNVPGGQPATTGTFAFEGELLVVDGATEFDFDLDGTADPAQVHMELERR
jgi:hypothetical protein